MPGLMRGMARTAAVVGTATATRNAVNRRSASKSAASSQPVEQAAPPGEAQYVEVAAASPEDDLITQLERLGALKAQGLLSEEEYAAEKAKLLNS